MAVHSQETRIPDCPSGFRSMWTGFSFMMVKSSLFSRLLGNQNLLIELKIKLIQLCCISKVKIETYIFQTLFSKCYKLIHCLSVIWSRRKGCWPGIRITRILSGGFPGHSFHWMPRQWSVQPLRHILQLLAGNTESVRRVPNPDIGDVEGWLSGAAHQSLQSVCTPVAGFHWILIALSAVLPSSTQGDPRLCNSCLFL